MILGGKVRGLSRSYRKNDRQNRVFYSKIINFPTALPRSILAAVFRWFPTQGPFRSRRGPRCGHRREELRLLTARNLLLAERPLRAELGGVHGGERGVLQKVFHPPPISRIFALGALRLPSLFLSLR